ncbi:NACHT domain-containing protein [Streptomyces exfoliatus]|uniref:NACHT domain-containing protein n=1 Tax=Streptomyces exfoliatus TaxID=1905 RepID=UPI003C2FB5E3
MAEADGMKRSSGRVPTSLRVPPAGGVAPPVVRKADVLPLEQLTWQDVERLFLRLTERDGRAEQAGLYGTAGQEQEGIDLFVRNTRKRDAASRTDPARRYTTLQSKHVKNLAPSEIRAAVDRFVAGSWAPRSETFIYATTHSLTPTSLADELNRQADRLEGLGIQLVRWGRESIGDQLRQLPEVVDDFFGRAWVEVFCGATAAHALAGRLPGQDVAQLRTGLRKLYQTAFALQDTGAVLVTPPAATQLPVPLRFVTLDITAHSGDAVGTGSEDPHSGQQDTRSTSVADDDVFLTAPGAREDRQFWQAPDDVLPVDRILQSNRRDSHVEHQEISRAACDEWLAKGNLSVVAGGPGAGKSSVLRFVVTDLLGDEPASPALAAKFGSHLPVWMPFSFLCDHLQENSERSIESAATAWLTRYSAQHLHQLVTAALSDDRLLLVVDGLDEWTNEDSARPALTLLENFVRSRKVAAIVSSRPYALRRLLPLAGWRVGHLAPLSVEQQRYMVQEAFTARAAAHDPHEAQERLVGETADRFWAELRAVNDLQALATVPLFLLTLAGMWLRGPLPSRRMETYRELVDVLLDRHPAIRRRDVHLPSGELDARDIRQILAATAYELRQSDAGPLVSTRQWRETLVRALQDDGLLGYDEQTARRLASRIMDAAEGELGVVVPQGAATIGFAHRAVAEQLAGEHLVTLRLEDQKEVIRARADKRSWRDVLLALLAGLDRPSDVTELLDAAIGASSDNIQRGGCELAAEALAAGIRMPARDVERFARLIITRIEKHPWMPHRARLLVSLTAALADTTARRTLLPWFTRKAIARTSASNAYWALHSKDLITPAAQAILLQALSDPSEGVQHAAAAALAERFAGSEDLANTLNRLTHEGGSARTQAAALEALITGWPQHSVTAQAVVWGRRQAVTSIRTTALHAHRAMQRTALPTHSDPAWDENDRQWLLSFLEHDSRGDSWDHATAELVSEAAAGDTPTRDLCLDILSGKPGRPGAPGSRSLAWRVLLTAFHQDPKVKEWAADIIGSEEYLPFNLSFVPDEWADDPAIAQAAYKRLQQNSVYVLGGVSSLVRLARTREVRDLLIRALDGSLGTAMVARALAEHYAADPVAREALLRKINAPADEAAPFADIFVNVLGPADAVDRLKDLIEERPTKYLCHAIFVLARLWINCKDAVCGKPSPFEPAQAADTLNRHTAQDLARLCLDAVPDADFGTARGWIIGAWPEVPDVLAYARQCLMGPSPEAAAVLIGYGPLAGPDAAQIVSEATALLNPLEPALRALIAQELTRQGVETAVVLDLLEDWCHDISGTVRRAAATALAHTFAGTPDPSLSTECGIHATEPALANLERKQGALERLRRECQQELLSCDLDTGDDRRRTAWVIALQLGDLTLLDGIVEYDGRPSRAEFDDPQTGYDPQLTGLIATHWTALQYLCDGKLPERLAGRLGGRRPDLTEVWARLAPAATRHPDLNHALSQAVGNDPELLRDPAIFAWYADSNPTDPHLLRMALQAAEAANDPRPVLYVADRFPLTDPQRATVKEALIGTGRTSPASRLLTDEDIEAAVTGWCRPVMARLLHDDPYAHSLYRQLSGHLAAGRATGWQWPDAIAVTVGVAPPGHLPHLICRLADQMQRRGFINGGLHLLDAAVYRLRRDPLAKDAVVAAITSPGPVSADLPRWFPRNRRIGASLSSRAHWRILLAGVLAASTYLPASVTTALTLIADSDEVLHDNPLMTSRRVALAALDLLDATR